jgi:tRNA dimethylallyltransferase
VTPVVAVVGPTGAGKSALGIALASELGGEVVNADSMQLYQGMDIGTAKLPLAERGGIPHHVLDLWPVTQTASVALYQAEARAVIDELRAAGTVPVLVGGSGLYVRAVLDKMEFPGTDPELRAALEADLAEHGPAALHARLAGADPGAAAAILPSNGRRIVRALEVIAMTGSFTATLPAAPEPHYPAVRIGVDLPPEQLDRRIEERVERMWSAGLVEEVRALERVGLRDGATASRALGYAQVLAILPDADPSAEAEAVRATQAATRRFIRRQRSWFGREARVSWLVGDAPDLVDAALRRVDSAYSSYD